MIDTSSVEALVGSIPRIAEEVDAVLLMKPQTVANLASATVKLAQRGFIGCVPLSHEQRTTLVLRLLPGRQISACPVADTWHSNAETLTIAPELPCLVSGRLAQLDIGDPATVIGPEQAHLVIDLAEQFGDRRSTEQVLATRPQVSKEAEAQRRSSALWLAMNPDLPWCQVMAGLWSRKRQALEPWLTETLQTYPDEPMLQRVYVCHHVLYKTGVDVTPVAWKIIEGDCLFDANYTGAILGPSMGLWDQNALASAVRWINAHHSQPMSENQADLWPAAHAYASDAESYDGKLHVQAANRIRERDPVTAYVQLANAAGFESRVRERVSDETLQAAQDLAREQHWNDLAGVLEMSRRKKRG